MNARQRLVLFVAFAAAVLSACGGADPKKEESNNGHVRLLNASSVASLDFYSSDSLLSAGVTDSAGSEYALLKPGGYTFKLKEAGLNTTLATSVRAASEGQYNTLVAYTTGGVLKTTLLDDNEGAPGSGTAKLRVVNTSTEAGTLDVFVTSASQDLTNWLATISGAAAEQATGYQEIGAGTYRIRVTGAGTPTDVRLDLPSVTLGSQQIATLVLSSTRGGMLVNGVMVDQRSTVAAKKNPSARMRLVAGTLPASSVVAATVNGVSLQSASPHVGGYTLVPAGALALNVLVNGSAASVAPLTANAGDDLTLLVLGTAGAPVVKLLQDDNRPPIAVTNAKLRLVHGLNNLAGTLSLTADSSIVADGLALGEASTFTSLIANTYQIEVTSPGVVVPIVAPNDRNLVANKVYTLFVLGDAAGTPTVVLNASR